MVVRFTLWTVIGLAIAMYGQSSNQDPPPQSSKSTTPGASSSSDGGDPSAKPTRNKAPDLTPPRSDRVNAGDLGDDLGESSSKETKVDLSAPPDDSKTHPQSSDELMDAGSGASHPWDPHKAAKDIEVGDFYFKVKKNYRAAESRYREALYYKDNDAIATFRLAICLEKLDRPEDARAEYESYLRILPHGPEAETARKAIERLKSPAATAKSAQ
jgi:Tetratricopeptide repeat